MSGRGPSNACALLPGAALLPAEQLAPLHERVLHTLQVSAQREGELANWLPELLPAGRSAPDPLVQWCHGAPGVVLALTHRASPQADAWLLRGAELVWRAGPLRKGPDLCHGTAGNGYALLAAHARTGAPHWLERARRFAVYALTPVRAAAAQHGRGRYALWTGDLGVALFAQDCIDARAAVPVLDDP